MIRSPAPIVRVLGALFSMEGFVGLVDPEAFRALVMWLQSPPGWPLSVALRVLIGIALVGIALPVRSALAVRSVGVMTLVGAGVGLIFTDLDQAPHGAIWRVPALALLIAGVAVVWGAGKPR